MKILVTGGTGYIGTHTCVLLLENNHEVVIVDNLSNSKPQVIDRIKRISGRNFAFYKVDLLDRPALYGVFAENRIDGVIHFAGLKAVGESVKMPLRYYGNNLAGAIHLLQAMEKYNVRNLVFSSSATVYGDPHKVPITEDFPLKPVNPYGVTKRMIEEILCDICKANPELDVAVLRYFNPAGAHCSGEIGEDPNGTPNNLIPFIAQVAIGNQKRLGIYGNDYKTKDGTGVRDYIHVMDLAHGHICALEKLQTHPGFVTYNLGTGIGYSVLEMVEAFKQASQKDIPYIILPRRQGDIAECYADPTKAQHEMGFKTVYGIKEMCKDAWNWQIKNPNGYESKKHE